MKIANPLAHEATVNNLDGDSIQQFLARLDKIESMIRTLQQSQSSASKANSAQKQKPMTQHEKSNHSTPCSNKETPDNGNQRGAGLNYDQRRLTPATQTRSDSP